MNGKVQYACWILLFSVGFTGLIVSCATTQSQVPTRDEERMIEPLQIQLIVNSNPPGATIYSVQGEPLGSTPLTRSWTYLRQSCDYYRGNMHAHATRYINANNSSETYFLSWDEVLFDTRNSMLITPGHQLPTGPSQSFGFVTFEGGVMRAAQPSNPELNFSFIAQKDGFQRQTHTVRCGLLLDYIKGRQLTNSCQRTIFLEQIPTAPDIDLRLKIKQPQ